MGIPTIPSLKVHSFKPNISCYIPIKVLATTSIERYGNMSNKTRWYMGVTRPIGRESAPCCKLNSISVMSKIQYFGRVV